MLYEVKFIDQDGNHEYKTDLAGILPLLASFEEEDINYLSIECVRDE